MKINSIYPPVLLVCFLLAACSKDETPLNTFTPNGNYVKTQLSFSVGERAFVASALMDANESGNSGGCNGQYGSCASGCIDVETQWTRYFPASRTINITRQDDSAVPQFRLNLVIPNYDLDAPTTPLDVDDAQLTLYDLQHVFVPISDDPAANNGPAELRASGAGLHLSIASVRSDVVEGTFSGTVKTANGAEVSIENGQFLAKLIRK